MTDPDPDVTSPPRRYKADEEMSVQELLDFKRDGERPETPEYIAYEDEVHRRAGLETRERGPDPDNPEDWSIDDYLDKTRSNR